MYGAMMGSEVRYGADRGAMASMYGSADKMMRHGILLIASYGSDALIRSAAQASMYGSSKQAQSAMYGADRGAQASMYGSTEVLKHLCMERMRRRRLPCINLKRRCTELIEVLKHPCKQPTASRR